MLGSVLGLVYAVVLLALSFFFIAFAVKYGVIWAIRTLSDDDLAKIRRGK